MKKDYYVDAILGDWVHNKKKSNKEQLEYNRSATLKLHKDNAVVHTDPENFKNYRVFGEVVLTETKLIDIKTSIISLFRGIELLPSSEKELII